MLPVVVRTPGQLCLARFLLGAAAHWVVRIAARFDQNSMATSSDRRVGDDTSRCLL